VWIVSTWRTEPVNVEKFSDDLWRTEPVNVEKFSDDLWVGVKG